MIATTLHSVRPVLLARSARVSGLPTSVIRAVAARPVTTFRPVAFKQEEQPGQEAQVKKSEETQVQKAPGMGASMVAPYARGSYGRLPSIFQEMQREMDALSRSFFDDDFFMAPFRGPLFEELQKAAQPELPALRLATDIEEDDKAFTITADVPGMGKEDIKLKLLDHTLTITGERKEEAREGGEEGDKVARYERRYGSFMRTFALPKNVDADGITATAKDGVLRVVIPKVEEAKPEAREIPVSA